MILDDDLHLTTKMTGRINEKDGVSVPPNSHLSSVIGIWFPTMRIKIPMVLVKSMKRKNQAPRSDNNGDNKKKPLVTSKKSFGKKVGSMFSNVFGKKNSMDETAEEMKKLSLMIGKMDIGIEKTTVKINEEFRFNNGVRRISAEEKPMVKEWPKSRRPIYLRNTSERIDIELNKGKDQDVVGTKGIVENSNGLSVFRYKTPTSRRTIRTTMASEKQLELSKKRILMGIRCRPLGRSGKLEYDENGFLIPETIP
ncbi:hypothetical protein HRI_002113500 [Hibiscus trionum]|uniref:Uncharacterized protein n=1 Tax=Hibiscus trionum TaxID=183268 RepID=A0A9W7HVX7_HIBTR|nr:hypothetical protein HRI_002113500 [Hibiscus trionum]